MDLTLRPQRNQQQQPPNRPLQNHQQLHPQQKNHINHIDHFTMSITDMNLMDQIVTLQQNQQKQLQNRPQLSNHTIYIQLQAATQDQSQLYFHDHRTSPSTTTIYYHGTPITKE